MGESSILTFLLDCSSPRLFFCTKSVTTRFLSTNRAASTISWDLIV